MLHVSGAPSWRLRDWWWGRQGESERRERERKRERGRERVRERREREGERESEREGERREREGERESDEEKVFYSYFMSSFTYGIIIICRPRRRLG